MDGSTSKQSVEQPSHHFELCPLPMTTVSQLEG
jgi:hypothetical protein